MNLMSVIPHIISRRLEHWFLLPARSIGRLRWTTTALRLSCKGQHVFQQGSRHTRNTTFDGADNGSASGNPYLASVTLLEEAALRTSLDVQKPGGSVPTTYYDTVVVGAGPYGLSATAQLLGRGVKVAIFGRPLQLWREKMPRGMLLRFRLVGHKSL